MDYAMLRLSLTRRESLPLFDRLTPEPPSRSAFLIEAFNEPINFLHMNRPFGYVQFDRIGSVIVAAIGRQRTDEVSAPPESGFQIQEARFWRSANLFIDTDGRPPHGQRVAFQINRQVGQPLPIMRSLIDAKHQAFPDRRWNIAVEPISRQNDFWSVVEQYRGQITEIEIAFIPPNILGTRNETTKALKKLHQENNAQQVEVKLKNFDGQLNPDSRDIRESVDYISKGGGALRIRTGKKPVYDTEQHAVTKSVEDDKFVQEKDVSVWRRAIKRLFG